MKYSIWICLTVLLILCLTCFPIFARTGEVGLSGVKLDNVKPEVRIKIRELLADYRLNRRRAGPAYSHYILSTVFSLTGQFEEARRGFEKVTRDFSATKWAPIARESLAELLVLEGKMEEAVESYEKYLEEWKVTKIRRKEIYFRIATLYSEKLAHFDNILDAYKKIARHPEYNRAKIIRFLGGFFKGYHLLKAHYAVKFLQKIIEEYKDSDEATQSRYQLGLIFGYDLSDFTRATRYLEEIIKTPTTQYLEYRRRAMLLMGLIRQYHNQKLLSAQCIPFYLTLLNTEGTDEIRTGGIFFLGKFFEDSLEEKKMDHVREDVPDPNSDTRTLRHIYLDESIPALNRSFYLYLTALNEGEDPFFVAESAYRASMILAYYYNDTTAVKIVENKLEAKFPESEMLGRIADLYTLSLPKIYDTGFEKMFAQATRYYEDGDYKAAVELLAEITERAENSSEAEWALYTRARIFEEDLGEYATAIKEYTRFLTEFPNATRADKVQYQLGRIYELNMLDYNRARDIYEKILAESQEQMWVFQAGLDLIRLLKDVFNKKNQIDDVLEDLYKKVPARRDEILYLTAIYKEEKNKTKDALEDYRLIIKNHPSSSFFDAALSALVKERAKEGLRKLDQKISRTTKGDNTEEVALFLEEKLKQQLQLGDETAALKTIDTIKKQQVNTHEVHLLELQEVVLLAKTKKTAPDSIKLALKIYKESDIVEVRDEALFLVAKIWDKPLDNWSKSAEACDLLIARGKTPRFRMRALYRRGVIAALREKDFDKAWELYQELVFKYYNLAEEEGIIRRIQGLMNIDVSALLSGLPEESTEVLLSFDDHLSLDTTEIEEKTTGEMELLGQELTIEDAKPLSKTTWKFGNWFSPLRVNQLREGNSWFATIRRDTPSFWEAQKSEINWFAVRKNRKNWDRGSMDEEIARQEQILEKLSFESSLPPVDSPKTVYYLDFIKSNPEPEKLPIVLFYLGQSYHESYDSSRALSVYRQLIKNHAATPEASMALEEAATILATSEEFSEARLLVDASFKKQVIDSAVRQRVNRMIESREKVLDNENYADANPGTDRSIQKLQDAARIYEKDLDDSEAAVATLNRISSLLAGETKEIEVKENILRIARKQKDWDLVDSEYRDIVQRFRDLPDFDKYLIDYSTFLINNKKDFESARPYLLELIDFWPNSEFRVKALSMMEQQLPTEETAARRDVYNALLAQAPTLELKNDINESLRIISIREKIANIRSLIAEIQQRKANCNHGNEGCHKCDLEDDPELFTYYRYLASLYDRELGDPEGVIAVYDEVLALHPPDHILRDIILKQGEVLIAIGEAEKAAELYRKYAMSNFDGDPEFSAYLQFLSATSWEEARKWQEAEDAYQKTSLYFPLSSWAKNARIALRDIEERKKKRPEKKVLRDKFRDKSDFDFELVKKTDEVDLEKTEEINLEKAKDPEERLTQIYEEIEKDELASTVPPLLIEAAELEKRLKREDMMMENYQKIVENFPQYRDYFEILYKMAEAYKAADNLDEAIPLYKRIVDEQPQFRRIEYVQLTLGKLYQQTDEFIQAQEIYQQLVDQYPDEDFAKDAQYQLGVIREVELQEYDAAIAAYRNMADRYFDHPKAVDALIRIGVIRETVQNDYIAAQVVYQEVLDKYPDTGRRREVIEAIERVQRLQQ